MKPFTIKACMGIMAIIGKQSITLLDAKKCGQKCGQD